MHASSHAPLPSLSVQSVQLFMTTPLDPLGLDYHIACLQSLMGTCLSHAHLQDELYCQLLRQLSGHTNPSTPTIMQVAPLTPARHHTLTPSHQHTITPSHQQTLTPSHLHTITPIYTLCSPAPLSPAPPSPPPQGWYLLHLLLPIFLPQRRFRWYLQTFLERHTFSHNPTIIEMAKQCQLTMYGAEKVGPMSISN